MILTWLWISFDYIEVTDLQRFVKYKKQRTTGPSSLILIGPVSD